MPTRCVLLQEGVLLQRSGAHIGPFTSPGFFTIFNSRGVSLRGLATFDALNGGQGMCTQTHSFPSVFPLSSSLQLLRCADISQSDGVVVDGITMRNTWWWNTEVEHSTHVTIQNYKIPNVRLLGRLFLPATASRGRPALPEECSHGRLSSALI